MARSRRYLRSSYTPREAGGQISGAATGALLVPAALILGGFLLYKRSQQTVLVAAGHDSNALPGMSGFGKSFKKAVGKVANVVTKISPTGMIVGKVTKVVGGSTNPFDTISKLDPIKLMAKTPLLNKAPFVARLASRGRAQPTIDAEPGQPVVYQDVNGKIITEQEYNAIMGAITSGQPRQFGTLWAMPDGYMITAAEYASRYPGTTSQPPLVTDYANGSGGTGTSFTSIYTPEGNAPNQPTGGASSGGGADYSLPPEAPTIQPSQQQYAAAPADMPQVAEKKFNPLIAIGALLAVPVVMGLTGGK